MRRLESQAARLTFFLAALVGLGAGTPPGHAEPSAGGAGLRVYLDPDTGAIAPPPATEQAPGAQEPDTAGAAAEPLVAVPSIIPGRGVMIDPRGRVRADVEAAVAPDGTLRTRCVTRAAPAAE